MNRLSFITLLVLVLLSAQVTHTGQIGAIVGDQDRNDETGVSHYTAGSHSKATQVNTDQDRNCHEIVLFGQRIRTPKQPHVSDEVTFNCNSHNEGPLGVARSVPVRMPSIPSEVASKSINGLGNDGHPNEQSNAKRRCVYDDVILDVTGGYQPYFNAEMSALTNNNFDDVIRPTADVHMTEASGKCTSEVLAVPEKDQFHSDSDTQKVAVTKKRKLHPISASKVDDQPELDLNKQSIRENYEELCRLLGKEMNVAELAFLSRSVPKKRQKYGYKTYPITIKVNGNQIYLPEWSQMRSSKNTLVKLILVARLYQKLHPIWYSLDRHERTDALKHQYHCARTIMLCLTHCCGNNLIQFQKGRDNPFKHDKFRNQRCPDHMDGQDLNVKNLNQRSIDVNYRDLCRLLGKPDDAAELTWLSKRGKGRSPINCRKSDPIAVNINGQALHINEWSQIRSAQSTVVKLILLVRFHQKLDPIWDQIGPDEKTDSLRRQYKCVCSIMFCVQHCCGNNLKTFHERWDSPFRYSTFHIQCCSAAFLSGSQCGFFEKQPAAA